MLCLIACTRVESQQPSEPVDINPIDGEVYYIVNQFSGLQLDLNDNSSAMGSLIVQEGRSFTSLSQRWALTALPGTQWAISNMANGLCLDSAQSSGTTTTVQNACTLAKPSQQWLLQAATNGYITIHNAGTGLVLDVLNSSPSSGAAIDLTPASGSPSQSQQWLLRPAFFRGVDSALLEKQESERVASDYPWWQDAGQPQDVLQILKNHGVNMIRIRPTSEPPYQTYTATSCTGNGCYTETDAADLDLARRAKQLGMAVELTLFYDGDSSAATPGSWSGYSLTQAESAVYSYVKAEIEAYRVAGAMPDMVTIGNEVDTGFFGALGSPTGNDFGPFAALQQEGMLAIADASSDTSVGPALPQPIRCIHITPAWDLTSFFTLVNSNSIPYDAICQSYYPIYHGPLSDAQAAASNPVNKPVEQDVLTKAAALGKPIFLIEVGEHYENGFDANDPWYPATPAGQRQFLIDVDGVMKGLPNNLGMGIEYWDAAGVNIPKPSGGYANGDGLPDAIYTWNGLTLFDNADSTGNTLATAANYSAVLTGMDALGGRLDPTLVFKLVNVGNGQILQTAGLSGSNGIALKTGTDANIPTLDQQWTISSNGDGYFLIANRNVPQGDTTEVLDTNGSSSPGAVVVANAAVTGTGSQEWNVVTAGSGTYAIVNKTSDLVLAASSAAPGGIQQQSPSATTLDWVTPANPAQQWRIIPAHVTGASVATTITFSSSTPASIALGSAIGAIGVNVEDISGSAVLLPATNITLVITGPKSFSHTETATTANGIATFDLSGVSPATSGAYSLTASAAGLPSVTQTLTVNKGVLTVTAQNTTRIYGLANPTFTYTITGFENGDPQAVVTGAPSLSTTALVSSSPGIYPIAIGLGTLAAANYTFNLVGGTLTVTASATSTALSASATSVTPGQSVTLTATVTSPATLTPSGTLTFLIGSTALGSSTLSSAGIATLTSAALPPGTNTVTASYAGNTDFNPSLSAALTIAEPDFTLAASNTSLTTNAGGSASTNLTLTPVGGYRNTVALTCKTALSGVTCSFNPASFTADGSNTVLTGAVTVSASSSASLMSPLRKRDWSSPLFTSVFFIPLTTLWLFGKNHWKALPALWRCVLLVGLMSCGLFLSACGGGGGSNGTSAPQPVTGVVTVTAAGSTGSVSQSINLNVTIQ